MSWIARMFKGGVKAEAEAAEAAVKLERNAAQTAAKRAGIITRNRGKLMGAAAVGTGAACYTGTAGLCTSQNPGWPWERSKDNDGNDQWCNSQTGVCVSHPPSPMERGQNPFDPTTYLQGLFHFPSWQVLLRSTAIGVGGGVAVHYLLRGKGGVLVCVVVPVGVDWAFSRVMGEEHSMISSAAAAAGGFLACSILPAPQSKE